MIGFEKINLKTLHEIICVQRTINRSLLRLFKHWALSSFLSDFLRILIFCSMPALFFLFSFDWRAQVANWLCDRPTFQPITGTGLASLSKRLGLDFDTTHVFLKHNLKVCLAFQELSLKPLLDSFVSVCHFQLRLEHFHNDHCFFFFNFFITTVSLSLS